MTASAKAPPLTGVRLLFVVNVDWFFLSHRLPIALAAQRAGADVAVAALDTGRGSDVTAAGLRFVPLPLSRQGRNPLHELIALLAIARLYRRVRPDILHHVAPKPILYGSLAASMVSRRTPRINAISGLGYSFSSDEGARWLKRLVRLLYRVVLRSRRAITIFQNTDDLEAFVAADLVRREQTTLIRGSGVDPDRFPPREIDPAKPPIVMLASRMLSEKGVNEFVAAAGKVRQEFPLVRFVLVGGPDRGNPTTLDDAELGALHEAGEVEWWGHRVDMPDVLSQAAIVVLPTYYPEGLPKVLLEAAAAQRPIVATDVPGCREIVREGVNGVLVPPRDADALAAAIRGLLAEPERCRAYGEAGRSIAVAEFTEEAVVEQTLRLYHEVLRPQAVRSS